MDDESNTDMRMSNQLIESSLRETKHNKSRRGRMLIKELESQQDNERLARVAAYLGEVI